MLFPVCREAPRPSSSGRAVANKLLIIPGKIFSRYDTHFRISYAASDETLDRGIQILRQLAEA